MPQSPDRQRLEQALRAADAAGDTVAATQIAQALRGASAQPRAFMGPQAPQPEAPSVGNRLKRLAGSGVRMVAEGAMDVVSPWADVAALGLNAALPGKPFPERHSEAFSQNLTEAGLPEPQGVEKVANVAGRMVTGAALGGLADKAIMGAMGAARPAAAAAPPTAENLKKLSSQAYQQAESSGVMIDPKSFVNSVGTLVGKVAQEGIDPTLHPQATAALKRLTDAAQSGQPIPLQQLETLRKIIKGAAGSISKDERRIARIMVDELDDYALGLSQSDVIAGNAVGAGQMLRSARDLWSRASKSEAVEELITRAQNRASQFSGSGYENALRTEFRSLIQNQKRLRLFTPVEQNALRSVARGGPIENVLRYLGKLAPTGVVSTALSGGIGAVVGGAPGAVGVPLAGAMARQGATALTSRNARLASELMRRGGAAPAASMAERLAPMIGPGAGVLSVAEQERRRMAERLQGNR